MGKTPSRDARLEAMRQADLASQFKGFRYAIPKSPPKRSSKALQVIAGEPIGTKDEYTAYQAVEAREEQAVDAIRSQNPHQLQAALQLDPLSLLPRLFERLDTVGRLRDLWPLAVIGDKKAQAMFRAIGDAFQFDGAGRRIKLDARPQENSRQRKQVFDANVDATQKKIAAAFSNAKNKLPRIITRDDVQYKQALHGIVEKVLPPYLSSIHGYERKAASIIKAKMESKLNRRPR